MKEICCCSSIMNFEARICVMFEGVREREGLVSGPENPAGLRTFSQSHNTHLLSVFLSEHAHSNTWSFASKPCIQGSTCTINNKKTNLNWDNFVRLGNAVGIHPCDFHGFLHLTKFTCWVISRFTWERNKKERKKRRHTLPSRVLDWSISLSQNAPSWPLRWCCTLSPGEDDKEHHQQNSSARLVQIQNYSWWIPILSLIVSRKREKESTSEKLRSKCNVIASEIPKDTKFNSTQPNQEETWSLVSNSKRERQIVMIHGG